MINTQFSIIMVLETAVHHKNVINYMKFGVSAWHNRLMQKMWQIFNFLPYKHHDCIERSFYFWWWSETLNQFTTISVSYIHAHQMTFHLYHTRDRNSHLIESPINFNYFSILPTMSFVRYLPLSQRHFLFFFFCSLMQ